MSFVHNQPRWADHEQHARYFAVDLLPFARHDHYFAENQDEHKTRDPAQRKCLGSPVARSRAEIERQSHENTVMIDLTRHHRLARELLRHREAYDSYFAELATLIGGIYKTNALIAPDGLIPHNFTPMK